MKNQDRHLKEDQMIRALVDEHDLTTAERTHLLECSLCQKEKQECEQALHRLGDLSKEQVPSPQRRFIPLVQGSRSLLRWQPALAAGVVIVLLMIGIWWASLFMKLKENGSMHTTWNTETDQQLLTEVMFREDDALSDRYLTIIGNYNDDDSDNYYDSEFLEFVLPL